MGSQVRSLECGGSKDSISILKSLIFIRIIIVKRGEGQRKPFSCINVCFLLYPALKHSCVGIVLQSCVLDKLLLNVSGHLFLTPLVTKTRTIVPHITVLVEIEPNQTTVFIPRSSAQLLVLESYLLIICFAFRHCREI